MVDAITSAVSLEAAADLGPDLRSRAIGREFCPGEKTIAEGRLTVRACEKDVTVAGRAGSFRLEVKRGETSDYEVAFLASREYFLLLESGTNIRVFELSPGTIR